MIKEIKFVVTNEVRRPKEKEWFLSTKGIPVCAAQSFLTSRYPILKMEIVEDRVEDTRVA
jgi:hypothetical protein